MEALPTPNTPDYIEILKVGVEDKGNRLLFTFRFARRMTEDTIYEFFQDPASTVWTTVSKKLHEKGWTDEKSNYLGTIIETPPRPSEDRKTWVLGFQWKGPERAKS